MHGRIFQTIDDFRDAVRDFVLRYNTEWLIEKNGHLSPAARTQRMASTRPAGAPHSRNLLSREPGAVHVEQREAASAGNRAARDDDILPISVLPPGSGRSRAPRPPPPTTDDAQFFWV